MGHGFQEEEARVQLSIYKWSLFFLHRDMKPGIYMYTYLLYHGDPSWDWISIGVAQQSQQEPCGAGAQHTQAGHIGVVSEKKTKYRINISYTYADVLMLVI